jgi:hypothetical protein
MTVRRANIQEREGVARSEMYFLYWRHGRMAHGLIPNITLELLCSPLQRTSLYPLESPSHSVDRITLIILLPASAGFLLTLFLNSKGGGYILSRVRGYA